MLTQRQPSKSPHRNLDLNVGIDSNSLDPLFMENIKDTANALAEIMTVCGIHHCKATATKSVIIKAFQFYDNKRHRFDVAEKGGISRNDIVCAFQRKCLMTYIEALLAYTILKRAVKAYFHGMPYFSIRSPIVEAVILKEQQFMWQHAAIRTIQLFERFEHIFFYANQNYAKQVIEIYKKLYERLKSRADPVIVEDCNWSGCVKKVIVGTKSPPKLDSEKPKCNQKCGKIADMKTLLNSLASKEFPIKSQQFMSNFCDIISTPKKTPQLPVHGEKSKPKKFDLKLPRCYQCNCPLLICDCKIEPDTGIVAIDCSQGPYECQWVRVENNNKTDPCIEEMELHQCPIDCTTSESSSESDDLQNFECSIGSESDDIVGSAEEEHYRHR